MTEDERLPVAVQERLEAADNPAEVDLHEDRTKEFKSPNFSRFPTEWDGPYADVVRGIHDVAEARLLQEFGGALKLLHDIYDIVREPVVDKKTGEVETDKQGFVIHKKDIFGYYVEDYSRLTIRQKDDFIHRITVHLFEWEQRAAGAWGNAMLAKGVYEETFAEAFVGKQEGKGTDAMRENHARATATSERFFGVFLSYYSRKADAVVRSMTLICQRLKDTAI